MISRATQCLTALLLLVGACTGTGPTGGVESVVPFQPLGVVAEPGNGLATVTWLVPIQSQSAEESNVIIQYTVVSTPGNFMATCPGLQFGVTVTGLTNGTTYTFQVYATNMAGNSEMSAPSNPVVPSSVPGPPLNVTATNAMDGGVVEDSAVVTWDPPASQAASNSPLIAYTVTAVPAGIVGGQAYTVAPDITTATLVDLDDAVQYTFTVVAVNSVGQSVTSAASNAVTTVFPPGTPTNVTAQLNPGDAVTLFWDAPADEGGSFISAYLITPYIGSTPQVQEMTDGATPSITFAGLDDGVTYTFQVLAVNLAGQSATPGVSSPVVPSMSGD